MEKRSTIKYNGKDITVIFNDEGVWLCFSHYFNAIGASIASPGERKKQQLERNSALRFMIIENIPVGVKIMNSICIHAADVSKLVFIQAHLKYQNDAACEFIQQTLKHELEAAEQKRMLNDLDKASEPVAEPSPKPLFDPEEKKAEAPDTSVQFLLRQLGNMQKQINVLRGRVTELESAALNNPYVSPEELKAMNMLKTRGYTVSKH
jgi:hypothetical protein